VAVVGLCVAVAWCEYAAVVPDAVAWAADVQQAQCNIVRLAEVELEVDDFEDMVRDHAPLIIEAQAVDMAAALEEFSLVRARGVVVRCCGTIHRGVQHDTSHNTTRVADMSFGYACACGHVDVGMGCGHGVWVWGDVGGDMDGAC